MSEAKAVFRMESYALNAYIRKEQLQQIND